MDKKFPQKTGENLKYKEFSSILLGMLENISGDRGDFIQNAWNSVLFFPQSGAPCFSAETCVQIT